jgi:hypothetical protein
VTFYPLRLFQARELRRGRGRFWNPYIQEGSFVLPALYPPDLLHVFWSGPAAVSWLLTLHFPLAAMAMHWLARELGASRKAAAVAGALYAVGGLAVSSLNLYVFLQALALAPLVAGTLRRAAQRGGRSVVMAAGVLALSLTTLAVEFVLQGVLLGALLGLAFRPARAGAVRMAAAGALGVALAALPVALVLGIVGQTVRGRLRARGRPGQRPPPVALLQVVIPGLFGSLALRRSPGGAARSSPRASLLPEPLPGPARPRPGRRRRPRARPAHAMDSARRDGRGAVVRPRARGGLRRS